MKIQRVLPLLMCVLLVLMSFSIISLNLRTDTATTDPAPETRMLPPETDLATDWTNNFTAYGPDKEDYAGEVVVTGDINTDGYADLIIGAKSGDGKDNTAPQCGEVFVFRGRDRVSMGGLVGGDFGKGGSMPATSSI